MKGKEFQTPLSAPRTPSNTLKHRKPPPSTPNTLPCSPRKSLDCSQALVRQSGRHLSCQVMSEGNLGEMRVSGDVCWVSGMFVSVAFNFWSDRWDSWHCPVDLEVTHVLDIEMSHNNGRFELLGSLVREVSKLSLLFDSPRQSYCIAFFRRRIWLSTYGWHYGLPWPPCLFAICDDIDMKFGSLCIIDLICWCPCLQCCNFAFVSLQNFCLL